MVRDYPRPLIKENAVARRDGKVPQGGVRQYMKQYVLTTINRSCFTAAPYTYKRRKTMLIPMRGDIYVADLGEGMGSEQENERPVVIVQNNKGNAYADTTIVVPITSRMKNDIPNHVIIHYGILKTYIGCVLTEQVRTISIYRLKKYIGTINEKDLRKIDKALKISLELNKNDK